MRTKHNCSDCVHRKDDLVPCDWLVRQNHIVVYCPDYKKGNPWKRINDGFSNLCNEETYQRTCPFCKRQHEQRKFINIICQCGGKYYFAQEFWLDRKTGERKQDGK